MTNDPAADLHSALLAAYSPYVRGRAGGADVDDAVAAGERWLDEQLGELLAQPFDRQRRSPLEVFQEAMRFPTDAMAAAGLAPVDRDPAAVAALPGDLYGLAPTSSQELGDEAWRAHLAWGAAKARAMAAPPVVLYFGNNLMDRTTISAAVEAAGATFGSSADPTQLPGAPVPMLALVDLTHPESDAAIAALATAGVRTVAFGPHVDDHALVRARALGASDALARSVFFRRLPELLPTRA